MSETQPNPIGTNGPYHVVQFREGDIFIAQCLEHDISAFASDPETLVKRFAGVFVVELNASLERGDVPFAGIDPAPEKFHEMWGEAGEAKSITIPGCPPMTMAMAMAA